MCSMAANKHIVLLPVEVPVGLFCWDFSGKAPICDYFDNEGGHSRCSLIPSWDLKDDKENKGVLKAPECSALNRLACYV